MRLASLAALLVLFALPASSVSQEIREAPKVVLNGLPFSLVFGGAEGAETAYEVRDAEGSLLASGTIPAYGETTVNELVVATGAQLPLSVRLGDATEEVAPTITPPWFSLVPPIVAVALALLLREAIAALFAGVWIGALAVAGFNPIIGTWRLIDDFIVQAIGDVDGGHPQIIVFSLLLGGMVGIVSRNGGTLGIVQSTAPFARNRRRGAIATWLGGMAIFFDDYANTLIVGNTMRSITDRLKISREKLAYLVDSTAAPVAALVPLSTWVGYEISLIGDGLRIAAQQNPALSDPLLAASPFNVFIQTIPYRFYPLLALFFAAMIAFSKRDFGPMAAAEKRAISGGGLYRPDAQLTMDTSSGAMAAKEGVEHRWWNAAVPVLTVILVVLIGLYTSGRAGVGPEASLMDVFGAADPFATLLWGSLAGCIVALAMSSFQRILTVKESIDALLDGMRAMMGAMLILTLAWSLGSVTEAVGTAQYLSQILNETVPLALIPAIVFVTAAAMSFATGTSWGTMAILIPLVIPLTVALGGFQAGLEGTYSILLGSISSVLAGAIFGDHCSPISDTTVLSSMASGCDHIDHVRTQLPYALLVGVVGIVLGDIGTAYGLPIWVALGGGMLLLWAVLRFAGQAIEEPEAEGVSGSAAAG